LGGGASHRNGVEENARAPAGALETAMVVGGDRTQPGSAAPPGRFVRGGGFRWLAPPADLQLPSGMRFYGGVSGKTGGIAGANPSRVAPE